MIRRRHRRGVALALVLWLIVIIGSMAAGVMSFARSSTAVASNVRARTVARYAAESGITLARQEIEDRLVSLRDTLARHRYLNQLDQALGGQRDVPLGDAVFSVALVDVNARLDVNAATAPQLTTLFSYFTGANEAADAAAAIRRWIGADDVIGLGARVIDSVAGITLPPGVARPLRSLDDLRRIPGLRDELLRAAAPFLTVDGDGRINRATASDTVMAAAAGQIEDEPSRVLVVSRGWTPGHALTHEIQAVYAIAREQLVLVRWRERDL